MVGMKALLIVFHSLAGGTRQMAEAAARGAEAQAEVSVRLLPAVEAQPADVLAADGYIFATPEMLAAISGLMKDFFDRTYYPRAGADQRPPVCDADLRRQRRPERRTSDRADCDGVAAAVDCGPDHRVHARPDPGSDLCAQGNQSK